MLIHCITISAEVFRGKEKSGEREYSDDKQATRLKLFTNTLLLYHTTLKLVYFCFSLIA